MNVRSTVSAVHVEDSSSASVNVFTLKMIIQEIKQTLSGVYEITPEAGSAFFLRASYLNLVAERRLCINESFTDEEYADILNAALIYSVEVAAMSYLARAEQCRSGLTAKLLKKGFNKSAVEAALDYLESVRYLDDGRFAGAWLRNRAIDHVEGRLRLSSELFSRGISRVVVKNALDEFFSNHDEHELCRLALKKCLRQKKEEDKIYASLQRSGFSIKEIRSVLNEQRFKQK
ncbi:MAG: recombination regulator RecX [Treponema sp.]|nr:recombination regulator RecX [Treponema sp.]